MSIVLRINRYEYFTLRIEISKFAASELDYLRGIYEENNKTNLSELV